MDPSPLRIFKGQGEGAEGEEEICKREEDTHGAALVGDENGISPPPKKKDPSFSEVGITMANTDMYYCGPASVR